ncbi:receptor-type tyrosine-protein phosphatase U-like isoform X6 [Xenia sp. Carnegie-2017]|nr:receptor-type tyrosine-protein phosphatase U-like isoform X6 [Xenia sp. Carnegie-2017]
MDVRLSKSNLPNEVSVEGSMSLSSLMHQSFIPGIVKCDARVNDLSQCAITQNNDCSQYSYVTCHVCDNPLLKNAEKFPDSWFTAFPKSRSAAKARISSGSSWCAPAANGNHYLQLNFPSLYTVNVITIFGDSSSSSFVTKYHLQTNIDGVNWKSEKSQKIYLGNKNGYNDAAIEKFSGGLKSKALRIFPLKFVGAPCLRIEICGGDLLPDKPTDLIATKSASTYLEISWKHPKKTGVKLGTNISNPLTRYLLILLKDTMIVFDKTLEVTDKKPYNITNLVPYATYKVNVTAGNSEGFGRSTTATFRTAEDVPEGPPLNVQIVALSSSSLSVTWEPPDKNKTNGKIVNYTVCITHLENETCSMKYMIEEQRLDINNVKPGTKYYVRVLASTIVGSGCYSNVTWVFTNGLAPELSTKQIGNTLTYLLQNPNVEYRYFYVVAMKNVEEESRLPSNFNNTDLVTYSKAISSTQPMPYIAAVVSRRDFKPNFILGDGETTTRRSNRENYYNGPLKPGTNYKIFQRVFINDQSDYYSTDWSPVAATAQKHKSGRSMMATNQSTDGGKIGAIAVAVVAAILLIIFVILVILFVRIN